MNFFQLIGFALRYGPLIALAITTVEALKGRGNGEEKKTIVINAVREVLRTVGVQLTPAQLEMLDDAVELIVKIFNYVGGLGNKTEEDATIEPAAVTAVRAQETAARDIDIEMDLLEERLKAQ